ncbi:hypothetical protein E4P82_20285 [Candidatus Competibacter phosphatis]|uniref:Sulfatase-modifying factor enzyme-like domain-containing protein n=1 Tax=Candidatus Competibacter phosphatis TaxID=221280 RepID=A0ABX1TRP5_9GAMM|nr:SUMF1/EgtB/PvdO family nonheme iron enzyme [Candidatus Competibacter phosphatis]NMQ21332.1 hypothetical protein [Candidatus Competibacter phosphatis]
MLSWITAALGGPAQSPSEPPPGTRATGIAENDGSGAVALGDRTVAAGAGGAAIQGNVYGNVAITNVPRAEPDAERDLRVAYLSRVREQCGTLSLAGIDPAAASQRDAESRLRLDAVYTALLTRTPRERAEERDSEVQHRRPDHDEPPLSALEQLDRHPKLVLQGDPGSGKSTFVNFVALCLAGEALGDERTNLRHLTAPLPDGDRDEDQTSQSWSHGALLPVPVVLRDFAATGLPRDGVATAHHLWAFIEATLKAACQAECVDWLRHELRERGGLLLLDGLDEVPEAERRRKQVKQAVEDFVKSFGKCRVLVTSRTYAYQNQGWRLRGFSEAALASFSDGQIRRFVANWYAHAVDSGRLKQEDAAGRAELLKQAIFNRPALYELAQRPLLLTLMASLHAWHGGSLPNKREALYAETADLLLNRWEQRLIQREADGRIQLIQPSLAEYLKVERTQVRGVLESLAFEAHRAQPELTGTADIAEDALAGHLLRLSANPDVNPRLLVDYLRDRAGVLYPRGVGVYTFPHRSFQEYLAACYLTDDDYPDKMADLARADPDRWREVALLAGAKAARGSASTLWLLVEALCWREPDDSVAAIAEVWGAQIAAQAIVETADLSRLSPANQTKLARVRRWLVKLLRDERLPATERALAGDNLAVLGDPRFDAEHWHLPAEPLFGFIEIPAGPFLMGSDRRHDAEADDDECPQHEVNLPGYYLTRWPVTVAQFAAFVEESGFQSKDPDCLKGVANHPVVWVSWHDALAYCRWLNEELRKHARERLVAEKPLSESECRFWQGLAEGSLGINLPSEAEWEKGARGTDGRIYPWGNDPNPNRANYDETGLNGTSAVGCFPGGVSPYECEDLSGNVWEWTRSLWGEDLDKPTFAYSYDSSDGREDLQAPDNVRRVLRGGAFLGDAGLARCAARFHFNPDGRSGVIGFRVVVSPLVFSDR